VYPVENMLRLEIPVSDSILYIYITNRLELPQFMHAERTLIWSSMRSTALVSILIHNPVDGHYTNRFTQIR